MPDTEPVQGAEIELAYLRPQDVAPDPERPGLLRGPDFEIDAPEERDPARHRTAARDCAALPDFAPDLLEHGFCTADLSELTGLQALLGRIRAEGRLDAEQAAAIRRQLVGRSLRLSGGRRLKLLFLTAQGFILRAAGPNGMPVAATGAAPGFEPRDGAVSVHADQDVRGTPLRQIMRGAARWLFHHEAPDSRNRLSRIFLLNLWIPLEQVTRPLTLMDQTSLDRRRHQVRVGLRVDGLLERDADQALNHLWSFLHDDGQRWYFTSEMSPRSCYVFDTLGTPHGSTVLPGEELAEARHRQLDAVAAAADAREAAAVARAARGEREAPGPEVTAPLRRAIAAMDALLDEAAERAARLAGGDDCGGWRHRAREAQGRVVRKSIEMRGFGLVTRDAWPFDRW